MTGPILTTKLTPLLKAKDIHWLKAKDASQLISADLASTEQALERAEKLWGKTLLTDKFRNLLGQRGLSIYDYTIENHFTASAIVINPATCSILMTFHPWYKLWLQLGGHDSKQNPARNPLAVSALEALEESGIDDLWVCDWPIRIDPHPARQCRAAKGALDNYHYDICYMLVAQTTDFKMSNESVDMDWISITKLKELVADGQAQQRALDMVENALRLYDALVSLKATPAP